MSDKALAQLKKLPVQVGRKFRHWVETVERDGLSEARKIRGYNDELLKTKKWKGYRSIRLNDGFRAFYKLEQEGQIRFVSVEEVNNHGY